MSFVDSRREMAAGERRPSVDPRHGDPLGGARQRLHRLLEDPDRLFDVVVHDGQIKEVTVRRLQNG